LPFCQPWRVVTPTTTEPMVMTALGDEPTVAAVKSPIPLPQPASTAAESIVIALLVGGLAARGGWLVIGAWVLGRIRREATPLAPLPEAIARAQQRVGATAAMYVSARIAGPVTFGLRQPVVVFPPGVASMEGSISAEHGLGTMKTREALAYKSGVEVSALRAIRAALDPKRIMNPRVLF